MMNDASKTLVLYQADLQQENGAKKYYVPETCLYCRRTQRVYVNRDTYADQTYGSINIFLNWVGVVFRVQNRMKVILI